MKYEEFNKVLNRMKENHNSPPMTIVPEAGFHEIDRFHPGLFDLDCPRRIAPHFSIYNFDSKSWIIINNQMLCFQTTHMGELLDQFNHISLINDVQYTKDDMTNYLSRIQD